MTSEPTAHIKPSKHSTEEVDEFLAEVQGNVDGTPDAGSPAIMPKTDMLNDGKPAADTPKSPRT